MITTNIITKIKYNYIQLRNRIISESPAFFVRLRKIMFKLGCGALAVITANASVPLTLPATLITVLSYIVAVCLGVYGSSFLTTKEKE